MEAWLDLLPGSALIVQDQWNPPNPVQSFTSAFDLLLCRFDGFFSVITELSWQFFLLCWSQLFLNVHTSFVTHKIFSCNFNCFIFGLRVCVTYCCAVEYRLHWLTFRRLQSGKLFVSREDGWCGSSEWPRPFVTGGTSIYQQAGYDFLFCVHPVAPGIARK